MDIIYDDCVNSLIFWNLPNKRGSQIEITTKGKTLVSEPMSIKELKNLRSVIDEELKRQQLIEEITKDWEPV